MQNHETTPPTHSLYADWALLADGWARHVVISWDETGRITHIARYQQEQQGLPKANLSKAKGPIIPLMPNLHSHSFQRVIAGLSARRGPGPDSFWTWRDIMYRAVQKLTPDSLADIALWLGVELLHGGYGTICEFHYLHRDPQGKAYANPAETSLRTLAALRDAGLAVTHLPVLYRFAGLDHQPLGAGQLPFACDRDFAWSILEKIDKAHGHDPRVALGLAPHSIRAVDGSDLAALANLRQAFLHQQPPQTAAFAATQPQPQPFPLHIHLAEQRKEQEDCLAATGHTPIGLWAKHAIPNPGWTLIHATHATPQDCAIMADAELCVGLCPTTEADLGDGLFPLTDFIAAGGHFGIGSDSQVSRSALQELALLEYGQRLGQQRRNICCTQDTPSVGRFLWQRAAADGAHATGQPVGQLAPGYHADFAVIDCIHPDLEGLEGDSLLDSLLFANPQPQPAQPAWQGPFRDIWVGGKQVIENHYHPLAERAAEAYQRVRHTLFRS